MVELNIGEFTIYKYKILDWELKKNNLLKIYSKSEKKKFGNVITNWNGSLETKNYLKREVENLLLYEIQLFKKQLKNTYYLESLWFQEYEKDMNHSVHNHGSGYSSVLYIEYDPTCHKPTTFVSNLDKKIYSPKVNEGEIIFFNSKYDHFCPQNESIKKRIICAFNLKKLIDMTYN